MAGVDFRGFRPEKLWPTQSRPRRGRGREGCAGVGFGAIWAGGFLPVEAAGGCKTVAGQYDPKAILGEKTLDPKGDAYCGSKES